MEKVKGRKEGRKERRNEMIPFWLRARFKIRKILSICDLYGRKEKERVVIATLFFQRFVELFSIF